MTRVGMCVAAWMLSLGMAQAQTPATVYAETVTLTDAQIRALPSTSVQVVPAPGAGKALVFLRAVAVGSWTAANGYTNVSQVGFLQVAIYYGAEEYQASDLGDVSPFGIESRPMWQFQPWTAPAATGQSPRADDLSALDVENVPFRFVVTNGSAGDFTGGNAANTLTVTVYYLVVDL